MILASETGLIDSVDMIDLRFMRVLRLGGCSRGRAQYVSYSLLSFNV